MTTLYKLTDKDGYTRRGATNETLWGDGISHKAKGRGKTLCSNAVIHAYLTPELALLLNPIHANIDDPLLWEAKGNIVARDGDLKVGCRSLTTVRRINIPNVTMVQRVAFGILCAKSVYTNDAFVAWSDAWLSGTDRSADGGFGEDGGAVRRRRSGEGRPKSAAAANGSGGWHQIDLLDKIQIAGLNETDNLGGRNEQKMPRFSGR